MTDSFSRLLISLSRNGLHVAISAGVGLFAGGTQRTALAMRWLISYARARGEKTMAERLAAELILASKGEALS